MNTELKIEQQDLERDIEEMLGDDDCYCVCRE